MELRTQIEKAHYNSRLSKILENPEARNWCYGAGIARPSLRKGYIFLEDFLKNRCSDKQILDYGCGTGVHSMYMAKRGAFVTGIDISDVAIKVAKVFAKKENVSNRCNFLVGNVEKMGFPDNSFDIVFSSGMMAYLDLDKALSEVCRVLKKDGIFLGIDTLGHNPVLNLSRYIRYKRGERTTNTLNSILRMSDLKIFKKYFGKTEFRYFDLMTFLAIPFEKIPKTFVTVLKSLESIDNCILHFILKRYAFKIAFVLSHPLKYMREK